MTNKKRLKKIKHLKHKNFQYEVKKSFTDDPTLATAYLLAKMLKHENLWGAPYALKKEFAQQQAENKADEFLAAVRINNIAQSLNWDAHSEVRNSALKEIAEKRQMIRWQALVSNLAIRKDQQGRLHGFLLLDKIVRLNQNDPNIYVMLTKQKYPEFIDYHMWLPIDNIRYFGDKKLQEIAQGDCIQGISYINEYKTKDHVSYGFGITKLLNCGVIITKDINATLTICYKAIDGYFDNDYSRLDGELVKLTYKPNYLTKLNRYRDKTINNLQHLPFGLYTRFNIANQYHYDQRFSANQKAKAENDNETDDEQSEDWISIFRALGDAKSKEIDNIDDGLKFNG